MPKSLTMMWTGLFLALLPFISPALAQDEFDPAQTSAEIEAYDNSPRPDQGENSKEFVEDEVKTGQAAIDKGPDASERPLFVWPSQEKQDDQGKEIPEQDLHRRLRSR